jgi:hypothetical protein
LHFRPGLELLEDRFAPAATITVNSALDNDVRDNPLTLREAILVNNRTLAVASLTAAEKVQVAGSPSDGDADTIAFAIPAGDVGDPGDPDDGHVYYRDDGGGVSNDRVTRGNVTITTAASDLAIADIDPDSWFSLQPTTTLPALTDAVILDGFSQPGASANTKAVGNDAVYRIEINGQRVTSGSEIGLTLSALASTLRGIVINGWHHGVAMSTDSHLEGAFVGADVSGTVAVGNVDVGVLVPNLPRANIGGPAPAQRNLISGNQTGIGISGPYEANASVVVNNYIGTNAAGTASLGNRNNGVEINDGHGNRIGGTTAAERNLISGNLQNGVIIYNGHGTFFSATGNIIIGNYIGTNATGDGAVPNLHAGVASSPAPLSSMSSAVRSPAPAMSSPATAARASRSAAATASAATSSAPRRTASTRSATPATASPSVPISTWADRRRPTATPLPSTATTASSSAAAPASARSTTVSSATVASASICWATVPRRTALSTRRTFPSSAPSPPPPPTPPSRGRSTATPRLGSSCSSSPATSPIPAATGKASASSARSRPTPPTPPAT